MKDKESKRFSFAHICAYLSLVISVTMIVLWCCNAGGFKVVSLDSFVGVIVALLAIVVTLVVGWQIYNSLEIKRQLEKLSTLKEKFRLQEKTNEQQYNKSQHLIAMIYGIQAYQMKNYTQAFQYFMSSLLLTMQLDNPINIDKLLVNLEVTNDNITRSNIQDHDNLNDIQKCDKNIRALQNYDIIESRYKKIYHDFNSKIKKNND
ncbi:MAG: hypothetical protein IKK36_12595 [Bacteroidales bacterium]|nr:hypothetical protein [Bacteroidales bacterium]